MDKIKGRSFPFSVIFLIFRENMEISETISQENIKISPMVIIKKSRISGGQGLNAYNNNLPRKGRWLAWAVPGKRLSVAHRY